MARNRQQQRLRLARMEAKRELRLAQLQRRRRDNILAGLSVLIAGLLAVILQVTTFVNNPTVAEMAVIEESIEVPSDSPATPTPEPGATATPSSSPSPEPSGTAESAAGAANSGAVPPEPLAAGQTFSGYTVMGHVRSGLGVVNGIAAGRIKSGSGSSTDGAPAEPVTIDSFTLN